jgi:hypothetical protein
MRVWLIIFALAGCRRWTARDTALEVAFVGSALVDWRQTLTITRDCNELNPMMGRCGDELTPNVYFPLALVAHAAIAAALPPVWRTAFQSLTTGLEVVTIVHNHDEGYETL